jgi:hypothetical protein
MIENSFDHLRNLQLLRKHFVLCNHNSVLKNNLIETTWEHTGCGVVLNVVGPSMMSYLKFKFVMVDSMHFCRRLVMFRDNVLILEVVWLQYVL